MALFGAVLIHYRAQLCRRLGEYAAASHRECSGGREELGLDYRTVSTVTDPLASEGEIAQQLRLHQKSHGQAELASRLCLSGPHKDDLEVTINGRSARQFASQGQTRTAALSLKLAEREIFRNVTGAYPVLLLDDVLSELDPRRQEYVLNRIAGGQVFITCCEEDRLEELLGGKVFHVTRQGEMCAGPGGGTCSTWNIARTMTDVPAPRTKRDHPGPADHRHLRPGQMHLQKRTRDYLTAGRAGGRGAGRVRRAPKSFVVCDHPYHRQIVYLCQLLPATLQGTEQRAKSWNEGASRRFAGSGRGPTVFDI